MRARLKLALLFAVAFGVLWAAWIGFSRGGQDFRVFHYAGKLVLEGRWDALYNEGPDRFLYAPGFALLISPLAAIPEAPALAFWLVATVLAFGAAMRALSRRSGAVPTALAVLFSMRALAIDLRYGQVNLLILSASIWALLTWTERREDGGDRKRLAAAWFVFALAAFAKIYPLALFLFPLVGLFREGGRSRRSALVALLAAFAGAFILLVPPLFITGTYPAWLDAIARKGLPTDTHNQSLLAFLVRVFGGEPFYSLGLGNQALRFQGVALSIATARGIWIGFSLVLAALFSFLAIRGEPSRERRRLVAWLGIALCFLPAHLIWKSYFVLAIPLLAAIFGEAAKNPVFRGKILIPAIVLGLFVASTSGSFIGPSAAGWLEALSPFLWVHLVIVATGFSRLWQGPSAPGSVSF
jgi:hypothetical protein